MKNNHFGNLMDWGSVLDKLENLKNTGELDNHQDELLRLLRFDGNWRLREAAVEVSSALKNPNLEIGKELVKLMKRGDLYYNIRIMATEALSTLIPMTIENRGNNREVVRVFVNEANHEVAALLSSPEPPIFHDALEATSEKLEKFMAIA